MNAFVEDAKQIVAILPKGIVAQVERGLIEEYGIHNSNFNHARGIGRFSALSAGGLGEQREKDILEVTVSSELADEIFEFIFYRADMNQPHGGVVYMSSVPKMSVFHLPELAPESTN